MATKITADQLSKFNPLNTLHKNAISQVSEKIKIKNLTTNSTLFIKGSIDDNHYYLLDGSIDLIVDNSILKTIDSNSIDALDPIIQITPRTVTAKAKSDSTIIIIDSDTLDLLLTWDQASTYRVQELSAGSIEDSDDWMLQLLRTEAFHRIPPANIQSIFTKIETISIKPGDKIITQDDEGDYFYIIKKGRCLVTRAAPNQATGIKLAELTDGDSFGEEALISDSKRNATVTMLTNGTLCRLSETDFLELLNEPSLEKVTFKEAQQLIDSESAIWLDVRLPPEHKNQHIKNSINIPLISLRLKINSMNTDKQYIIYCDSERRSSAASFLLNESGLNSIVLIDGIKSVPEEYRNS